MPIFYENCLKAYKKYPNIFEEAKKVKEIYAHILETKAIDLKTRLKNIKHYPETDEFEPFKNLHKTKLTAKQKEITYRLLYNITPTGAYKKTKMPIL